MKEEIKQWLADHGKDRQWLADQLGLTKSTVNNWLSTTLTIPEGKQAVIRRIFAAEEAAEKNRLQQLQPQNQIFSVEVTLAEFRLISQAAKEANQTIEEWSRETLSDAALSETEERNKQTPRPRPSSSKQESA